MKTLPLLIIVGTLFQSCIIIEPSSLREANPQNAEIANCKISSPGAVYMNIFGIMKTDFIPASIKIECKDLLVYADPLLVEDTVAADFIFITHNHFDHFSKKDIDKLAGSKTIIAGPKNVTKKLKGKTVQTVYVGDTIDSGRVTCEVVESYNLNSKLHKKGSNFVGYILTIDSTRIYIAGDTDYIPEMKDFEKISLAIVPIGEGKTAMNPESAAEAIQVMHPEMVIPVHYELLQNREQDFLELVNDSVDVRFFNVVEN